MQRSGQCRIIALKANNMRKFTQTWQTNWSKKNSRYVLVLTAAAVGALGTTLLLQSHAATPVGSIDAENGIVSAAATKVSDTTASSGQAVKFGPGSTGSTAKPDATNTGVPSGTQLAVVNGNQTYATDNQVITGKDIHGAVIITGKNVTLKNSIVRGDGSIASQCTASTQHNSSVIWVQNGGSATISDVEVAPDLVTTCLDGVWALNATLLRVNVHGAVDGVKAYDNVTIQDSYIHDMTYFASQPGGQGQTHNDGVQSYQCNVNILVKHNNIDLSNVAGGNANYQITQDNGIRCSNIVIDDNWLDGGGCTINIAHKVLANLTGVSLTNNRFGRHQGYTNCTVLLSTQSTLSAYSGNVWDDTGQPIPAPQVHD